jgi:hypothetical protein
MDDQKKKNHLNFRKPIFWIQNLKPNLTKVSDLFLTDKIQNPLKKTASIVIHNFLSYSLWTYEKSKTYTS